MQKNNKNKANFDEEKIMPRRRQQQDAIKGNELVFRQKDGLTIKAYRVQGLDLVIELQNKGQKEPTIISHTSSIGAPFYASLLKFLFVHKLKIPALAAKQSGLSDEIEFMAKKGGQQVGHTRFPFEYLVSQPDSRTVQMIPLYRTFNHPELLIRFGNEKFILQSQTVFEMARKIPFFSPSIYFQIRAEFLQEAQKHPEQIIQKPRGQLEFRFTRVRPAKPLPKKMPKRKPR